ncbi:hypothetical protein [Colwellia psychrerythraea]|uniref:Lipoprotein SmpA/OmlA domain-containing protein n=1 Tax=Colwellia psychrerythraea TaxID=28229 RepID=A0A099KND8_COLPS|nr:hypothetical protein [Colwellia psychrerythraea]KGJ92284.1 hypothetical protein GAB14E_2872 [Colwellia psychrerythraea]
MKRINQSLVAIILLCLLSGCVNYSRDSGVENLWRQPQSFTNGTTTNQQVLTALGPPSQVLAIGKQTLYYYLKEQVTREGLILLIYNDTTEISIFDRAMFIFDEQGILIDFSYSKLADNTE